MVVSRRRSHAAHRAGYSLTEIAIVLSVIGLIIAALWLAAYQAWEYTRREQVREVVATTVANARSYFAGQVGVPASGDYTTLTNLLLKVNVIPSGIQRPAGCAGALCADNPWGSFTGGTADPTGTFRVCNWTIGASTVSTSCSGAPAGVSAFFGISLTSLYRKSCIALVNTMSSASEPTGLVDININGTNLVASLGHPIQPALDSDVVSYCSAAADGSGSATFVYRVVAPAL